MPPLQTLPLPDAAIVALRRLSAAPAPGDRRQHPREPLRRGALLELPGRVVAVALLDLSEAGAGIAQPPGGAVLGEEGHLVLDTAVLPVRVASAARGRLGLAFAALEPAALATLRRVMAEERCAVAA